MGSKSLKHLGNFPQIDKNEYCTDKDYLFNMFVIYLDLKKYPFALDCLDRALLQSDNDPYQIIEIYCGRGLIYFLLNQFDLALENSYKALQFCSETNQQEQTIMHVALAIIYERQENWNQVIEHLQQVISNFTFDYPPFINILSHAIRIRHTKCVRLLLHKIYNEKLEDDLLHESYNIERVPLWNACQIGDLDLVQELVQYAYVDINADSFLKSAVEQNNEILVDYLLNQGCDIQLDFNKHILHHVVNQGYYRIVQSLLKCNANPNIQDYDSVTPLDYAVYKRDIKMIEILVKHTNEYLQVNANNFTPMMSAVYHNLRPIVNLLFRLLPFDQCIDDLIRLACRYTIDIKMENRQMAFYFFSQELELIQDNDHDLAESLVNIAKCYEQLNRLKMALESYQQVLIIYQKAPDFFAEELSDIEGNIQRFLSEIYS
ncbi:hypothetical protein I4U23_022334 [Adineta vaga]|nr:hypothetical protein I4U23_022334 [Adineta vaga]